MLIFIFACADGPIYSPRNGAAYLELTGVQTAGPQKMTLLFSEDLGGSADLPSSFTVVNASTDAVLPQTGTASVSGQTVTLSLADPTYVSPYRLVDGHVYDVTYNVSVPVDAVTGASGTTTDQTATAAGTERFTAGFLPPAPKNAAAAEDAAGNILVTWDADNRIGNTGLELWCLSRDDATAAETEEKIVDLVPYEAAYWDTKGAAYSKAYYLVAVNGTGRGSASSVVAAADAGVDTFSCLGICLKNESYTPPAGYTMVSATATCGKAEYYNGTYKSWIIREVSAAGMMQTDVDSTGASTVTFP